MPPNDDIAPLLGLFNLKKKKELERYCRDLVITKKGFTSVILAGRAGTLEPFAYACRFFDYVPEGLDPTQDELKALGQSKAGEPLNQSAKKVLAKIDQIFVQRRLFAAHLFYTPCHTYWYLFYFDQRDTDTDDPHWKHGAHVHLITDHFNFKLADVWQKLSIGDMSFSKLHIRYLEEAYPEE